MRCADVQPLYLNANQGLSTLDVLQVRREAYELKNKGCLPRTYCWLSAVGLKLQTKEYNQLTVDPRPGLTVS